jgi:hypothetical protein
MGEILPVDAEIRERGQLTIPKSIRTSSHMDEGKRVRVIPLGTSPPHGGPPRQGKENVT